jgi:predicted TPR repeat methyltransferase
MAQDIYSDGSYGENNPDWHGADAAWKAERIAEALASNHVEFESCTEIGCGTGLVLENLAKLRPGKSYTGYDVSPTAQKFWDKRQKGLNFRRQDFTTSAEKSDLILLIDVFEHVPDYLGFLGKISDKANWFVFHIPLEFHISGLLRDAQIGARKKVGHLHYFSRATALVTLEDSGYDVVSANFTKLSQQTVEGQRFLTTAANLLRRAIELVSPGLAAKLLGGYSLLVVCKRRKSGSK